MSSFLAAATTTPEPQKPPSTSSTSSSEENNDGDDDDDDDDGGIFIPNLELKLTRTETFDADLTCPHSGSLLVEPCTLSCGHTFSRSSMIHMIKQGEETNIQYHIFTKTCMQMD